MLGLLSPIDLAAIIIVAAIVAAALFRRQRLELKIGNVQAAVEDAAEKVDAVNHAVNNRPPSDPTLYEQVRSIGLKVDDNSAATHATNRRVTELASLLTTHIAVHQAEQDQRG